ncbi:hypothetical protein LPC08_11090 [Roseomonas sp. OT10]|uniref:hypothetical protein n=1 Tax=Roseomonas cutis TaxID=2897332 RepID=UPI001E2E99D7|nr:hypothetical protein [Roseomonas sp. OT10]UFN51104.1 hypothetical protein LPC08_11090 [Roseomonas sp. OT10]
MVLFDLPEGGAEAIEAAVWELSESHWMPMAHAMFVSCSVSASYLSSHLNAALRRAGLEGPTLVARVDSPVANAAVPPEAIRWLQEQATPEVVSE